MDHNKKNYYSQTPLFMINDLTHNKRYLPWRLTLYYAVFGVLWILLSDRVLSITVQDRGIYEQIQLYKGWFYIVLTSGLFYTFAHLNNQNVLDLNRRIQTQNEELWAANEELVALQDSLENTVTERTNDLIHANEALLIAGKQSSVNQIVRNLLHRINTPLGNCIAYTDLLASLLEQTREQTQNYSEKKHILSNINESEQQIVMIMDSLKNMMEIDRFESVAEIDMMEMISIVFYDTYSLPINEDNPFISIDYPDSCVFLPEKNFHIALSSLTHFAKHQRLGDGAAPPAQLKIFIETGHLKMIYQDPSLKQLDNFMHIFDPYTFNAFKTSNAGMELSILYNCVTLGMDGAMTMVENPAYSEDPAVEIDIPLYQNKKNDGL